MADGTTFDHETLSKFCSDSLWRKDLQYPFSDDDHTYSTNGMVAIRIPRVADRYDAGSKRYIDTLQRIFAETGDTELVPLPEILPEQRYRDCSVCSGAGKISECPTCSGEGELECDLGHEHECHDCNGDGTVKGDGICSDCNGTGKIAEITPVVIGSNQIDLHLVHLIAALPELRIAVKKGPYVKFVFKGGDGVVAPLREDFVRGGESVEQ